MKNFNRNLKIGDRFGKLTVVEKPFKKIWRRGEKRTRVKVKCDCGREIDVFPYYLKIKRVTTCGKIGCKTMNCKINLKIGDRFGKLVVIALPFRQRPYSFIKCRCDCGVEKDINLHNLANGRYKNKSCGCAQRKEKGEASLNRLIYKYKKNAINKNMIFEINKEQFRTITKSNCCYCGIEPIQCSRNEGLNGQYIYNGIDRVDNTKGYTMENCVPCCKVCNNMKKNLTKENFLSHIQKIYNFYFNFV